MKNIIGLFCNLFRAIEIAKLGNHTISIFFSDEYKQGFEDYESIKTFCHSWFDSFVDNGDMKIEIVKPYDYEKRGQPETINDIDNRINKALLYKKPEIKLCDASLSILKTAADRLCLSLSQIEKIKEIAQTISQLDLSDEIKPWHIAESIQYSYISDYETKLNGEKKSIVFGGMIEIKMGFIDHMVIDNAIKYLKEKL